MSCAVASCSVTEWMTWRAAIERALYGADGFYRRPGSGPAAHFRTSAHNPRFAEAVGRLLVQIDARLGTPGRLDFVDMAAGHGELAEGVVTWLTANAPDVAARIRAVAVEVGPRPEGLADAVEWASAVPDGVVGLLFANEWLDNVVFDVAEVAADGAVRILEVDPATGAERLGPAPDDAQRAWLDRWWPLAGKEPGSRAEIGLDRDAAWREAVSRVARGMAVAVDYAHTLETRPEFGTLTGYREGHQVPAIPDGSCDVTAHVALDACAGALEALGLQTSLTTQREFLHSLGITGARPPLELASSDPLGYLRALSGASAAAELTDPDGLGSFGWLTAFSDG